MKPPKIDTSPEGSMILKGIYMAELLTLRAQLMARAQEYNAIGYSLASSTSMQSTCTAIEHSGMAKGLLEAVEALDKMLFAVRAANDNHTA